jgi:hypothetical protein
MKNKFKDSIDLIAEFISPYEDNLNTLFIGDDLDTMFVAQMSEALTKSRKSLPGKLPPITFNSITTTNLFKGKAEDTLKNSICILYLDQNSSLTLIQSLTHELIDQMEAMLIDRFILQNPQEKFILDISTTPDDTLANLCENMDSRNGAFNYLISENLLAIWTLIDDNLFSN